MNTIDLQIQSTVSDGKHSPQELVKMARDQGLGVISLTDHDAVDGIDEALRRGEELGIRVIPGIEMSAEEHGIHILGYGINYRDAALLRELEKAKLSRIEGAKKMVDNLRVNEGLIVEWEDVLRESVQSSTITRPHIVAAVMKRVENRDKLERDSVYSKRDFFEKYLSDKDPNFVKRACISAADAIQLLHNAGGVAIWSHPPIPDFTNGGYEELEIFLKELIKWGIDGLEVFSASHTEDDVEFLEALAMKYKLLRTAGSDFHEKGNHPADSETGLHSARTPGDYETYGFPTGDIVEKLDEAISKKKSAGNVSPAPND